jgi:zinc protease
VGNHILGGGGFTSRLTEEVREKRGLSYSVYSSFAPACMRARSPSACRPAPTRPPQALQVSRDVLERFVAEGPTEAELRPPRTT